MDMDTDTTSRLRTRRTLTNMHTFPRRCCWLDRRYDAPSRVLPQSQRRAPRHRHDQGCGRGCQLFPESHHGLVPHRHGITEERLRAAFEGVALGAFMLHEATMHKLPHDPHEEVTWFVARGVKPE